MYKIVVSRAHRLAEITVSGYWSAETVIGFCAEFRQRLGDLPAQPGGYSIVCDLEAGQVAPADTMKTIADIMANPSFAEMRANRIAFYASSMMTRLQFGRLAAASDRVGVFEDRAAALTWLRREKSEAA